MSGEASLHIDDQVKFCWQCGRRLADVGNRCPQCGRRARISASVWYWIPGGAALFQFGWAINHKRSVVEVVLTAVGELALVTAFVWLLVNYSGSLSRRGGPSFGLSFAVTWLLTAAICVPIFSGADRSAEQLSTGGFFFTVLVFVPLLIGLVSAIPLSRGWRTSGTLVTCGRCETHASVRARHCMACGAGLRGG